MGHTGRETSVCTGDTARTGPVRSRNRVGAVVAVTLAAVACVPPATTPAGPAWAPSPQALTAVDSIVRAAVAGGEIVGISAGIGAGGRAIHSVGYGVASREAGVAAGDSTVYRIGSIAKQMTAAAVLRLEHEGRLSVSEPLERFLPDLPSQWAGVTIHHLLTHTSGIPGYTNVRAFRDRATEPLSVADRLAFVTQLPLEFEPGSRWAYSNTGYLLLGPVIERASGVTYGQYVEQMLAPLGLRETGACTADAPGMASGYSRLGDTFEPAVSNQVGDTFADGDLCSSVRDLLRWTSALARGAIVPQASYHRMVSRARLNDGSEVHYGYGFDVMSLDGVGPVVEHGGGVPGFRSHLAYYPAQDVAIVVLTNTAEPAAQLAKRAIERRVFAALLPEVLALELPADRAAQYEGTFSLYLRPAGMGPFPMRVFVSDGRLVAHAEGAEVPLLWQGGHEFADGMNEGLRLYFEVVDGRATRLTVTRAGLEFVGLPVAAPGTASAGRAAPVPMPLRGYGLCRPAISPMIISGVSYSPCAGYAMRFRRTTTRPLADTGRATLSM
jgi:CubicO group peptidase (beta-lactamase class C family)